MPMETGDDYTCLFVDGRPVGGASAPAVEGIRPHWEVYFNVVDTDAAVAQVAGLGGQVLQEPSDLIGVGRVAMLMDPQGAAFGLLQSPHAGS
jgi:predicted enzyme related to lactoylglutathione lyase